MEGPVTSASRTPTLCPARRARTASWLVTMDLPTPPLPDARLESAKAEAQQKLRALYDQQNVFERRLLHSFPTP